MFIIFNILILFVVKRVVFIIWLVLLIWIEELFDYRLVMFRSWNYIIVLNVCIIVICLSDCVLISFNVDYFW